MGSNKSVLKENGYTIVSEEKMMLVKNKNDDQFFIKKLRANKEAVVSGFFERTKDHPHIVHKEDIIPDRDCLYLVLEHCGDGSLAQTIQEKKEKKRTFYKMTISQADQTRVANAEEQRAMENNQILDWTVKICMALKHLHDQQILHRNLQPKSIFFTASGTIRLGEFGQIKELSVNTQTTQTDDLSYVAPENLSGQPFDEKSEVWSLGCVIYEMCMLKCAFTGRSTREIIPKILRGSYEALPNTFSADLRQLVTDTLQTDPANRPSVSEILARPFIIRHLKEKSEQTIEELKVRNPRNGASTSNAQASQETANESKISLKVLDKLADSLEKVHYGATVGSLTGGVVGLTGGILTVVGVILAPFTLGTSLIVTGVGIGVGVAGGVTAGASNVTKMVNQRTNQQNIKMIIRAIQEKICSTACCIQNIQTAMEYQRRFTETIANNESGLDNWSNAGARLGRGLGGIPEIIRLAQVASAGKAAAQTARVARLAETATGVLSGLFIAVDLLFIALDAIEIHKLRQDYALMEAQRNSPTATVQELQSKIMQFVRKIRETADELERTLNELQNELTQADS